MKPTDAQPAQQPPEFPSSNDAFRARRRMARISLSGKVMSRTEERDLPSTDSSASTVWDPSSLIEAEFILPSQLEGGSVANRTGEMSLLWAVFTDGVHTYCREVLRGSTNSLAYREVERWIFRPNSDAITSFSSLCELFGIDVRRMRRALVRFRECPTTRILSLLNVDAA